MRTYSANRIGYTLRRVLCILLALLLCYACVPVQQAAFAASDGMMRVKLTRLGTPSTLKFTTSCAYGFSRFQFPGKEFLFNLLLLTMMIPTMLAIIPQYTIINELKLVNTYQGVWLLWSGTCVAGNTFFYRGFFEQVPRELEESMFIDGATRLQVLRHIILPLTAPAIATQAVFAFNGYWMELFTVLTLIKTVKKRTLSVALQLFRGQHTTEFGLLFAASVIALIPVITIFIIFQKKFMKQGLTEGSLKG